jgi:hypothetical protein
MVADSYISSYYQKAPCIKYTEGFFLRTTQNVSRITYSTVTDFARLRG